VGIVRDSSRRAGLAEALRRREPERRPSSESGELSTQPPKQLPDLLPRLEWLPQLAILPPIYSLLPPSVEDAFSRAAYVALFTKSTAIPFYQLTQRQREGTHSATWHRSV